MELVITNSLQSLIFPPGILLLLLLLGVALLRFRPLLARLLLWSSLVLGYLLSTYSVAGFMLQQLQHYPALKPEQIRAQVKQSQIQAIVVLSADRYRGAPEYGHDTVGSATLERTRYGAYLQRQTGLPLLVSGGHVLDSKGASLAAVMAESLQHDFGVKEVWLEERSRTTAENAIYSQQLLQQEGIDTVLLVTHAYHMPRAVAIFEKSGLKVIAAPTLLVVESESDAPAFMSWLPSAGALQLSAMALHEWLGRLWYWIRY
jgi:uncharacterized SAM-binding protein YcdF (DUF218 family)